MLNTNEPTQTVPWSDPSEAVELLTGASRIQHSMADVARYYILRGVPVFPADPETKSPLVPRGFKARSLDLKLVADWWARWPNALIGLVPGDIGLVAIDIDKTDHARAARDSGHLSRAVLAVETGGKSKPFELEGSVIPPLHVYVPAGNEVPRIGGGVVVRYDAGFVIAPGSRRPNGRAWRVRPDGLESWPELTAAAQSGTAGASRSGVEGSRGVIIGLRAPDVTRLHEAVSQIPNGPDVSRDDYVAMAHMIRGAVGPENLADGLEIFRAWAAKWTGGTVNQVEDDRVYDTIIDSSIRTGWPQLHRLAAQHGYDNRNDLQAEAQTEFAADPDATLTTKGSLYNHLLVIRRNLGAVTNPIEREALLIETLGPLAKRYQLSMREIRELLRSVEEASRSRPANIVKVGPEMFAALAETQSPLARGFLFTHQQHVVFGEPASFKTFVSLDLGLSVASGRPWLEQVPTRKTGVVFFAGEAAESVHVRIAAWGAAHGMSPDQMGKIPFVVINEVPRFGHQDGGLEKAIEQVSQAEELTGEAVGLVIFDNLTRILARSGASNTDVGEYGRVLSALDEFARQVNAATLTIAHSPVSDSNRPSGTFQGIANPDFIYHAKRDDSENSLGVTIKTVKSRGARPAPAFHVSLKEQDATALIVASHHSLSRPLPLSLTPGGVLASEKETDAQYVSLVVSGSSQVAAAKKAVLEEQILALLNEGEQSMRTIRKGIKGSNLEKDRAVTRLLGEGVIVERPGPRGARIFSMGHSSLSEPAQEAA